MAIKQISVFLENKPRKILNAVKAIADAKINIRAMSLADTTDFGILRLIVSDIEKAKEVLSEDSLITVTEVIAVEMRDESGSLAEILNALAEAKINIEYMYAFTAATENGAYVVLRVDDNSHAEQALKAHNIELLRNADILK